MADFSFFSERRQSLVTQLLLAIPRTDWFLVVPALKQKKIVKGSHHSNLDLPSPPVGLEVTSDSIWLQKCCCLR
jgi:hypothetical protein